MGSPSISFVVATYRRPDALSCTLRSLQLQRHDDWEAIVIGDHCEPATGDAIGALRDGRIRYYNLPSRFGEQSGPNNAGLHLATGDHVVFLNHDDLLLQDHIDVALDALTGARADFYVARHSVVTATREPTPGSVVPVFTEIGPHEHQFRQLVHPSSAIFEPSSFWVVRADLARRVGPWRPARDLVRTPLRDWMLRAWRAGARFRLGEDVTGVWLQNHNASGIAERYAHASPVHAVLLDWIEHHEPGETRALIAAEVARADRAPDRRVAGSRLRRVALPLAGGVYRATGLDAVALGQRLRGRRRGQMVDGLLRGRTGERLPAGASIDDFLRDPEVYRVR